MKTLISQTKLTAMRNFKTLAFALAAASSLSFSAFATDIEAVAKLPYDRASNVNQLVTFDTNGTHSEVVTMEKVVTVLQSQLDELNTQLNQCLIAKNEHYGGNNSVVYTGGDSAPSCQYGSTVCNFYQQVTGGLPEAAGAAYWQGQLDSLKSGGMSDSQALAALKSQAALLPEAVSHAGTGGTNSGRASVDYSGNQSSYSPVGSSGYSTPNSVESIYQNVLGRNSDPAGAAWWNQQISSGAMSVNDMYNAVNACKSNGTCQ